MEGQVAFGVGSGCRMKVLLVIDHFGPGGAQRQIVELACGMQRRGHEIEMFVYFPEHGFFRPLLDAHGITVHEYSKGRGFSFGVLAKLIALLRHRRFDVVVSYLSSANVYAELAVAIAGDQRDRIRRCAALNAAVEARLASDDIAAKAAALLRDEAARESLARRAAALGLEDGIEVALRGLVPLIEG